MSGENNITHEDILEFFSDKTEECPADVKCWQKSGGYISLSKVFLHLSKKCKIKPVEELSANDLERISKSSIKALEFYKKLYSVRAEKEKYCSLKYLPEDFDYRLSNGEKGLTQKWHLFISYYAYKELMEGKMPRRALGYCCIELVLWQCKEAGICFKEYQKYAQKANNGERFRSGSKELKALKEKIKRKICEWKKTGEKNLKTP